MYFDTIPKIRELQEITDSDISEVEKSVKLYNEISNTLEPYKRLLDVYTADLFLRPNNSRERRIYEHNQSPLLLLDGIAGDPLEIVTGKIEPAEAGERLTNLAKAFSLAKEKKFFHWKLEFPEVWYGKEDGGFDVVIGNPPYVRQEEIKNLKPVFSQLYKDLYDSTADLYVYFYIKGIEVLRNGGYFSMITSNKFLRVNYGEKLRGFLSGNTTIVSLIDFSGFKIFEDATVDTLIIVLRKGRSEEAVRIIKYEGEKNHNQIFQKKPIILSQNRLTSKIWILEDESIFKIKEKIEGVGVPLKDWDVKIYFGIKTGLNEAFIIDIETRDKILAGCKTEDERERTKKIIKPVLRGRDIGRYYYRWAGLYLLQTGYDLDIPKKYPAIYRYLLQFKEKAKKRDDQGLNWWNLRACTYYPEFEKEKIVWQEIVREPSFAYDNEGYYVEATAFIMTGKFLKYLLVLLNSHPVAYFFKQFYAGGGLGEEGYRYKKAFLEKLPIPEAPREEQKSIIEIADKMTMLHKNKYLLQLFIENKLNHGTGEMIRVIELLQTHPEWDDNASDTLKKEIAKS